MPTLDDLDIAIQKIDEPEAATDLSYRGEVTITDPLDRAIQNADDSRNPGNARQLTVPVGPATDPVRESHQRLRAGITSALDVNADQYAHAARLATQSGIPTDTVFRNLPEVEREAKLRSFDRLAGTKLADHLARPEFARIAHDDVEPLAALEEALKWRDATPPAVRSAAEDPSGRIGPIKAPKADLDFVPPDIRERITKSIERAGLQPTDGMVRRFYEREQSDKVKKFVRFKETVPHHEYAALDTVMARAGYAADPDVAVDLYQERKRYYAEGGKQVFTRPALTAEHRQAIAEQLKDQGLPVTDEMVTRMWEVKLYVLMSGPPRE